MEATRQGWSGRKEVLGTSGNSDIPSSGCETRPAKAQSRGPVASLATERVTATAMRRHASMSTGTHSGRKVSHDSWQEGSCLVSIALHDKCTIPLTFSTSDIYR